jgi:hypothetical protein
MRIPTPYRGIARLLFVYCSAFVLIWAVAWIPGHVNIVETCNATYTDPEYYKKYPNEIIEALRLEVECQNLFRSEYDEKSSACVRANNYEIHEMHARQYLRSPTRDQVYACYWDKFSDDRTLLIFVWFAGIPLSIILSVVGWRLLNKVACVALAILSWVLAGFEKKT